MYYKLFILKNEELYCRFAPERPFPINQEQNDTSGHGFYFATLEHILDFMDEQRFVVCDVIANDVVNESSPDYEKQEVFCKAICCSNPRLIYSPSFLKELTAAKSDHIWWMMNSEDFLIKIIANCHCGKCYNTSLDYAPEESLRILLLDEYYDSAFSNYNRRKAYNYQRIFSEAKKANADRRTKEVIVTAWHINAPCIRSRVARFFLRLQKVFS